MTETIIKTAAAQFIKDAKIADAGWSQEAHIAFLARFLKAELALKPEQVIAIMEIGQCKASLLANASAFRQWLESKDVALLKKQDENKSLGNRYAGLV